MGWWCCWEKLGLDLDGMRPTSEAPPPSAHEAGVTLEMHDAAISSTTEWRVSSPSKGLSGVECLPLLAAAGRWLYGYERCVGDLATVLLHSCVRPAASQSPPLGSNQSEAGRSCCDSGCC
jgi:hypothetical protein